MSAALRRRGNWEQLVKFCVVGASGYAVNLAVYSLLVLGLDVHYVPAAICSFLVAVTNNYTWNRLWTFRAQRGHVAYPGHALPRRLDARARARTSSCSISSSRRGASEIVAQAIAIVLVTPVNFIGNKLWSFGPRG